MSHTDEALGLSLPSQDASAAVAVGASPFDYKVPGTGAVIVTGGTVTALSYGRNGTFTALGVIVGIIPLSKGDTLRITYTVLPTVTFVKR
jgi:predicted Rossmann-fold nucleotide-binding protein